MIPPKGHSHEQKKFPESMIRNNKKIAGKSKENDFDMMDIATARRPSILKYMLRGSLSDTGKTAALLKRKKKKNILAAWLILLTKIFLATLFRTGFFNLILNILYDYL